MAALSSARWRAALGSLLVLAVLPAVTLATGTWAPTNFAAPAGLDTSLLLPDGSLMVHSAASGSVNASWFKLKPDATGSYINGSWSTRASMNDPRLYFESAILPSGSVFVSGGEYSTNNALTSTSEIYNPIANTWTRTAQVSGTLGDTASKVLSDGSGIMIGDIFNTNTYIYHQASNTWTSGPSKIHSDRSDEESWSLLPDGSILSVDCFSLNNAQRFVPGQNAWVSAGVVPTTLVNSGAELGPGMYLPNGKVLYLGSTGHTALYTPPAAGSTATGSWVAGPDVPNARNADDAPAAIEPNGKVLFVAGSGFNAPSAIYEYDPGSNTMSSALTVPTALSTILTNAQAFTTRLQVLPTGQIMFGSYASSQAWIYTPAEAALAAAKPVVATVTPITASTFHLTGLQLNGLDEGSAYGDDVSNSTNFPLVKLVDTLGNVFYAPTFNESTMGIATDGTPVSTDFSLPTGLTAGPFTLFVIANGIASDGAAFDPATIPEPASGLIWTCVGLALLCGGVDRSDRRRRMNAVRR